MKKLLVSVALVFICAGISIAQHGTAEPGFYPAGFNGDTWTGEVTAANEDTREFTLTHTKGNKSQTFVGVLPKGYTVKMKDGHDYEIKMAELMGIEIQAYYITKKNKDANGVKVETHEVFKIKFVRNRK